jgi:6-phosphogluconolactonase
MADRPVLTVLADADAIARTALATVQRCARESIAARGRFTLALAGGSTPAALYTLLAQHPELPWAKTELCFGDERAVPPTHPESNARMVEAHLTHQPFIPPAHVHRIRGELPAGDAAEDYEQTLRSLFGASRDLPRFDLVLLGLGNDGHTASLFPHSPALDERDAWVTSNHVPALVRDRITLTYPVLNAAREIVFLVAGEDKAWALAEVLEGSAGTAQIPARGIRPDHGSVTFFADRRAASGLRIYRSP